MLEQDFLHQIGDLEVHKVIRRRVAWVTFAAIAASVSITVLVGYWVNGGPPDELGLLIAVVAP